MATFIEKWYHGLDACLSYLRLPSVPVSKLSVSHPKRKDAIIQYILNSDTKTDLMKIKSQLNEFGLLLTDYQKQIRTQKSDDIPKDILQSIGLYPYAMVYHLNGELFKLDNVLKLTSFYQYLININRTESDWDYQPDIHTMKIIDIYQNFGSQYSQYYDFIEAFKQFNEQLLTTDNLYYLYFKHRKCYIHCINILLMLDEAFSI